MYQSSLLPKPALPQYFGERRVAKEFHANHGPLSVLFLPSKEPHHNRQPRAAKRNDWSESARVESEPTEKKKKEKATQLFSCGLRPKRNVMNERDLKGGHLIYLTTKVANSIITSADNRCRSHLNCSSFLCKSGAF